jgi:glycosyltransferase involved in cell wall biosynthesis
LLGLQASRFGTADGQLSKLRVSVIGTLPPVKGISAYSLHLAEALSRDPGVSLEFVGFSTIYPKWVYPGSEPSEPGASAPGLQDVRVRNLLTWYNPASWLQAGLTLQGDVVHAQWWSEVLAPIYATVLGIARLRGKRVVMTVHNIAPHEDGWLKCLAGRLALRFAHAYIVHSERNRSRLEDLVGTRKPIAVRRHGALETPRSGLSPAAAREVLGLNAEAKVILCFGYVRRYKGIDVLLRAFAEVVRAEPSATLVVAGEPWVDWSPYDALIERLGIRDRVRLFLNFIPGNEVEAFFVSADVVVLPYLSFDSQSGAGARALPFGRALLVTDIGGLPELTRNSAAVVPAGDSVGLAEALLRIVQDDNLRDRLAADSLAVARELGWDAIAAATIDFYRSVLAREGTRGALAAEESQGASEPSADDERTPEPALAGGGRAAQQ